MVSIDWQSRFAVSFQPFVVRNVNYQLGCLQRLNHILSTREWIELMQNSSIFSLLYSVVYLLRYSPPTHSKPFQFNSNSMFITLSYTSYILFACFSFLFFLFLFFRFFVSMNYICLLYWNANFSKKKIYNSIIKQTNEQKKTIT